MSNTVKFLEFIYLQAKNNTLVWKPIYPNNMPCNSKQGIYADLNVKDGDNKWQYIKLSINYHFRCDEEGISYPSDGIKYYVLNYLVLGGNEEKIEIPTPTDNFNPFSDDNSCLVNSEGHLFAIFDDEETAKKAACSFLLHLLYPYIHLLNEEELKEWNEFVKLFPYDEIDLYDD